MNKFNLKSGYTIVECPFTEQKPKEEPQKFYCVKAFYDEFTKGKIYTFENGYLKDDTGHSFLTYKSAQDFLTKNPNIKAYLVPLVEREAKAGEYIVVTNANEYYDNRFDKGDLLVVTDDLAAEPDATWHGRGVLFKNITHPERHYKHCVIRNEDYLVLNGYKEQP